MKIGVLTGGGDAPGLNAAIRAVVKKGEEYGFKVVGIKYGWAGLLDQIATELNFKDVKDIISRGGTVLKTSRTNPIKIPNGIKKASDNFKEMGLDALIAIGGDDTLSVARVLSEAGLNVIGIPKTIDYDVPQTELTIGFDTAINDAMRLIESAKETAESHERVFIVEIMGRHAGWIALYSGLAAGADLVLLPEEPFSVAEVADFLNRKMKQGQKSVIIVIAEGALLKDYNGPITKETVVDQFGHVFLGGIGDFLAKELDKATGAEIRAVAPAHLIRGGSPTALDRFVATRYGLKAVELIKKRTFGVMVALKAGKIVTVPLSETTGTKKVDKELYDEVKILFR